MFPYPTPPPSSPPSKKPDYEKMWNELTAALRMIYGIKVEALDGNSFSIDGRGVPSPESIDARIDGLVAAGFYDEANRLLAEKRRRSE